MSDSWGSSWGTSWGLSWTRSGSIIVVDTHDGFDSKSHRKKKEAREELREQLKESVRIALGLPIESKPRQVVEKYIPDELVKKFEYVDFDELGKNIRDVNILTSLYRKKQKELDEEKEIIELGLIH